MRQSFRRFDILKNDVGDSLQNHGRKAEQSAAVGRGNTAVSAAFLGERQLCNCLRQGHGHPGTVFLQENFQDIFASGYLYGNTLTGFHAVSPAQQQTKASGRVAAEFPAHHLHTPCGAPERFKQKTGLLCI